MKEPTPEEMALIKRRQENCSYHKPPRDSWIPGGSTGMSHMTFLQCPHCGKDKREFDEESALSLAQSQSAKAYASYVQQALQGAYKATQHAQCTGCGWYGDLSQHKCLNPANRPQSAISVAHSCRTCNARWYTAGQLNMQCPYCGKTTVDAHQQNAAVARPSNTYVEFDLDDDGSQKDQKLKWYNKLYWNQDTIKKGLDDLALGGPAWTKLTYDPGYGVALHNVSHEKVWGKAKWDRDVAALHSAGPIGMWADEEPETLCRPAEDLSKPRD